MKVRSMVPSMQLFDESSAHDLPSMSDAPAVSSDTGDYDYDLDVDEDLDDDDDDDDEDEEDEDDEEDDDEDEDDDDRDLWDDEGDEE